MLEHLILQEDGTNVAMTNDTRNNYIDILRYYFIAIYQCFISIAASKLIAISFYSDTKAYIYIASYVYKPVTINTYNTAVEGILFLVFS